MLNRNEILNKIKDKPWVSPFEKIIGVYSPNNELVQIYEYHARGTCFGAAAWAVYHYARTSPLILDARRDGVRDIFTVMLGKGKLDLRPSFSSAGIEEVKIKNESIWITYAGLAGGGVGSSFCRGLSKGVQGVIIHEEGGGDKLGKATLIIPKMVKIQVGVDDTDKAGAGATWSLANEIAFEIDKEPGVEFLNHTLVQLFPYTPTKTTNCVATVLTFATKPDKVKFLEDELTRRFKQFTVSDHTGLAFWNGITIPEELFRFSNQAKNEIVTLEEAKEVAKQIGIKLVSVTGENGLIGAVAALGYAEKQDIAVIPNETYPSD